MAVAVLISTKVFTTTHSLTLVEKHSLIFKPYYRREYQMVTT